MHADRAKWNEKYSKTGPQTFVKDPSKWLVAHEELLAEHPKGKALDLACGLGRNSFFLAELGFEVDAIDISDVAIQWLEGQVDGRKLTISPRQDDIESCELPVDGYQVIVCFNFLERGIFPKLVDALASDGLLLFETFTYDHIDVLKKKFPRDFALKIGELRHSFPALETLAYREEVVSEGGSEAAVASIVARKFAVEEEA
jgi:SAM-dependent methyltransferase